MSTPWLFLCLYIKIKRGFWKINELCKICVIQISQNQNIASKFSVLEYLEICQIPTSTGHFWTLESHRCFIII